MSTKTSPASVASEITLSRALDIVRLQVLADQPTLLIGPPGLGKSAAVQQIVDDLSTDDYVYEMVDIRLGQMDVPDLRGLPLLKGDTTLETRPHWFPEEGKTREIEVSPATADTPAKTKRVPVRYLIFLDEITSAVPTMQAAAYQIVLERQIGTFKLPPETRVLAAGNRMEDNAVVHFMSSALRSRFCIVNVKTDQQAWDKWTMGSGVDERVIAFIRHKPGMLSDYSQMKQQSYPCPRTWDMLSQSLQQLPQSTDDKTIDSVEILASGMVGQGASLDFSTFVRTCQDLPNIEALLEGKVRFTIPDDPSAVDLGLIFGLTTAVAMRADASYKGKYIDAIFKFALSIPQHLKEFRVRVGIDAINVNPEVLAACTDEKNHPNVSTWFTEVGHTLALMDTA